MKHKLILVLALIICMAGCCHRRPITQYSKTCFKIYARQPQSIYFGFGKATIEGESSAKIDELISQLKKVQHAKLVMYGYTDRVGQDSYNTALAMRRINAVKKVLIQSGVVKANDISIATKAVGEYDPLISYDTINNNPKSRRVDVFIMS